jgi:hypothetical protein
MYAAAYFRVPILYCDTFTQWFLILHAANHKVSHFTKHLIWNFRFTDFQTSVDIRIGLNTRSFSDLNQSWIEVV